MGSNRLNRWAMARAIASGVGLMFACSALATAARAQTVASSGGQGERASRAPVDPRVAAIAARLVRVDLRAASLQDALETVAARARLEFVFSRALLDESRRVTLRATLPAAEAFRRVLAGTGLAVEILGTGRAVLVLQDSTPAAAAQPGVGTITGIVVDSARSLPVPGAAVVTASGQRATTRADGRFTLAKVPAGTWSVTVRVFGYRPMSQIVTVSDAGSATVRFVMATVLTTLTDVVTTATGAQRRLEVGNDVTTIDVDQVRRTAPVSTLTDVLEGRVPELVVTRSSGAPGAPSRVRIRGVGSLNGNNDPIIIIDGVRKYSTQTGNARDQQFSVLDNVDLNSVDKVDVLKGPSASALYGSDAANGVIVITTKRGRAGPTRWTFSTDQRRTTQPQHFPENVYLEGTDPVGRLPHQCVLGDQINLCTHLRVIRYNPLADPRTTVLGTGHSQRYGASVSGGSPTVQYFLSGQTSSDLGLLTMSDADVAYLERVTGQSVPAWQRRPQGSDQTGGTATLSLAPYRSLNVSVVSSLDRTRRRDTPLSDAIRYFQSGVHPADTSFVTGSSQNFRKQSKWNELAARNTLSAVWTPRAWWSSQGDAGVDNITREQIDFLRRGDCIAPCQEAGHYVSWRDLRTTGTVNLQTRLQLPAVGGIRLTPIAGLNYVRSAMQYTYLSARGLPLGGIVNGAQYLDASDTSGTPTQAGVFISTNVAVFDRLYWSVGTRVDGSNALGKSVTPTYPKLDLSYVVPVARVVAPSVVSALRLRTAYGHAAVQPALGAATRSYLATTGVGESGVAGPVVDIATLGNPALKPERRTEWEGGFELGVLDNRVTVIATGHRTLSHDALIPVPIAPSLGGGSFLANAGGTYVTNLGSVRGVGGSVSIDAKVLDRAAVMWDVHAYYSRNTNTLVKLAPSFDQRFQQGGFAIGTRNVVGYPINGVWLRPVVAYADANGDGAISEAELVRSDSAVFVGGPDPKYDAAVATTLGLWDGRVTVAANAAYRNGAGQLNQVLLGNVGDGLPTVPAVSDPATPLAEQAAYRSGYALAHAVNTFRLQSLSVGALLPDRYAQRFFRASSVRVKLEGSNLGLWTSYSGADPNVGSLNDVVGDPGLLPLPRTWGVNVTLTY